MAVHARAERWEAALVRWLEPFLAALSRPAQRQWAPVYLRGLLGPGERKSVEPMAARIAAGEVQQLHHFLSTSPWDPAPLERVLVEQAQRLVGGAHATLIIDDTALVKQGRHSVGVARQYCGECGKRANCQVLVSLTLAHREVPVPLALRLFLPEAWAADAPRLRAAGVPDGVTYRPKWQLALDELDRVRAAGARFGAVVADAGYGMVAAFRHGLSRRGLRWAVGVLPTQQVYPLDVALHTPPATRRGRPAKHPVPSVASVAADEAIRTLGDGAFRRVVWRAGTKGRLAGEFAAVRVRVADGPEVSRGRHLPGEAVWLVCERRRDGERRYYLANYPAQTSRRALASAIKARWSCEQAHQQLKTELGLDHLECRNWRALQHHVLLCLMAFCFLQHLRLGGKKVHAATAPRAAAQPLAATGAPSIG